jgi:outer membrane protein OmpA-like peptidoglycan-associated protein
MIVRWIGRCVVLFLFGQGAVFAQQSPLDVRDYLSLDLGATYSWHGAAKGFYFPYVYDFDTRIPSVAQKLKFVELGDGLGYRAGISIDLALLGDAAIRFSARYAYHTTSHREQANYDCSGNLGNSGMTLLETYYNARWQYVGGDMFLRKSLFGDKLYSLMGVGYSHLMSDELDGEQRIISSTNNCEYLWLPSGMKTGSKSVSVADQTSDNYYADGQYLVKLGLGSFFALTDDFIISPEIVFNIPLNRILSPAVVEEYDRQPAPTPKLWSTDIIISFRYVLGAPKEKYVAPAETKTVSTEKRAAAPEPRGYTLTGKVRNSVSNLPVPADVVVTRLDSVGPAVEGKTSLIGYYNITVPSPGTYSVTATARDYLFGSTLFVVNPDGSITSANHDIALSPEDGKIRLLIFFDVDKAELRDISNPELDRAVRLLKETPGMKAEIAGHTDSTGSAEHNKELSKRRAEAVRSYLIAKGIHADRVIAEGYGSSQPVAPNASETGRAENRRVEFVVRKK